MSGYDHSQSYLKDPSFSYMPMSTLDSAEDFSGAACIMYADQKAKIDLIVHSLDFSFSENHQIVEHLGDTYSTVFFGKAPLEVTVEATLPDSLENFGKTNLLDAYKNFYRASAVARLGKMPVLVCKNIRFTGPFTKLVITEDSESEDTCSVVLTMFAMKVEATEANGESVVISYTGDRDLAKVSPQNVYYEKLNQVQNYRLGNVESKTVDSSGTSVKIRTGNDLVTPEVGTK